MLCKSMYTDTSRLISALSFIPYLYFYFYKHFQILMNDCAKNKKKSDFLLLDKRDHVGFPRFEINALDVKVRLSNIHFILNLSM